MNILCIYKDIYTSITSSSSPLLFIMMTSTDIFALFVVMSPPNAELKTDLQEALLERLNLNSYRSTLW